MMHHFVFTSAATILLLLYLFARTGFAIELCSPVVSHLVKNTLDNGRLFSSCSVNKSRRRVRVSSLFDVLDFPERDFLVFCRSPECTKPIQTLLHAMPTRCLVTYCGSARNISEEISMLADKCAVATRAADKTDEEYLYKYFLD
ncbi:hypothetical protein F441_08184 [Phytophthora nicotianae CJ01A1]|uniref:Elicitin n=2 Tax=Phytophthora nicotianae TaxID=4792 RepID=W2J5U0_PHYNI|nr:hypothetical protein L915_08035 [Phytophthora nicotianae]ETL40973.1 hypothetical protein L916_07958 [Phytophthora nicotianae]ETP17415.1 hypothetical protein F441_08184 [Phytophthora nicotianae CJ01A1]